MANNKLLQTRRLRFFACSVAHMDDLKLLYTIRKCCCGRRRHCNSCSGTFHFICSSPRAFYAWRKRHKHGVSLVAGISNYYEPTYDILPFVWNFISRNCQTVHRSVHRPVVYCVLLLFRSVFIVFAPRSFFQSNRSTGIAKHVLYSISDALSTFVRERNSNNRFHRFFIETKMIPIYKLHLVGQ